MSEWKVSTDVEEVMLLDSQDIDYQCRAPKRQVRLRLPKDNLQQQELIAMKHKRVLVVKHERR
jgi:hypothetical protein